MSFDKENNREVAVRSIDEKQSASAVANLYMWERIYGQEDSTTANITLCTFALNLLAQKLQKYHVDVNAIDNEVEREVCNEVECRVEKSADVQDTFVEQLDNVNDETVKENSINIESSISVHVISNEIDNNNNNNKETMYLAKQEEGKECQTNSDIETDNFNLNKESTPENTFAEVEAKKARQSFEIAPTYSEQVGELKEEKEEESMKVNEDIHLVEHNLPEFTSQIEWLEKQLEEKKEQTSEMSCSEEIREENVILGINYDKIIVNKSTNVDNVENFVTRRLESRVAQSTSLSLSPLPKVSEGVCSIMKESNSSLSVPQHAKRKRNKATRSVPPLLTARRECCLSSANFKKSRTQKETHDNMFPLPRSISFQTEQSFVHENFNEDTKSKAKSSGEMFNKRFGTLTKSTKLNEVSNYNDNICTVTNIEHNNCTLWKEDSVCENNIHSRNISPQPTPVFTTAMTTQSTSYTNSVNKSHSLCKTFLKNDYNSNSSNNNNNNDNNNYYKKDDKAILEHEEPQKQHEHVERVTANSKTRAKKAKVNIIKRNIELTKSKNKHVEPNEFELPQRLTSILSELPITTTARSETLQVYDERNLHAVHKHDQFHEQQRKEKHAAISKKTKKEKAHKR